MRAADILLRHAGDRAPALATVDGLDELVDGIVAQARAAWPAVGLTTDEFLAAVAGGLREDAPDAGLRALRASDLYLASACARGDAAALAALERTFLAEIARRIERQLGKEELVAEVMQLVRTRLLVSTDGSPPRMAAYRGHGPLIGFIHVTAARAVIDLRFRTPSLDRAAGAAGAGSPSPPSDPEFLYMKWRYRAEVEEAFKATAASLSLRERNVLRLVYVENVDPGNVAELYRVSRRTVNRWLADARETLLAETRRRIALRLALPTGEVDEMMALVASQLEVSLQRILITPPS